MPPQPVHYFYPPCPPAAFGFTPFSALSLSLLFCHTRAFFPRAYLIPINFTLVVFDTILINNSHQHSLHTKLMFHEFIMEGNNH